MKKQIFILIAITLYYTFAYAQTEQKDGNSTFKVGLDLRPRFEYRSGFGTLVPKNGATEGVFVRQRSRVNFSYDRKMDTKRLKTFVALQGINTWGDTRQILPTDPNDTFSLFQAWAEYYFSETTSIKLGRQVLSYDDQRILGGLDWAMQGRNHDLLLFKKNSLKTNLHFGLAINNNAGEPSSEVIYTNNAKLFSYKYMQFIHYKFNLNKGGLSLLVLNNMFQKTKTTGTGSDAVTSPDGSYSRTTLGAYYKQSFNSLTAEASFYYQTGNSGANGVNSLGAYQGMLNLNYKTEKVLYGAGFEMLSGNPTDGTAKEKEDTSFFPLYGTNHKFNGFMDYFYVGNHAGNVGLNDINAKVVLNAFKGKFTIKGHYFMSNAKIGKDTEGKELSSYLGTEIDFVLKRKLAKDVLVIGGYSMLFGTESLAKVKGSGDPNATNTWGWIMVKVNPTIFTHKGK